MTVRINHAQVEALRAEILRKLDDAVLDMGTDAEALAPVDTGRLKNSIGVEKLADEHWRVTASAPYAAYVELGTRYQHAQPYLRPSAYKKRKL